MKHFPSINRRLYTINSRVGETSKMKINDYENESLGMIMISLHFLLNKHLIQKITEKKKHKMF